jgi:hypothetical protein
MIGHHDHCTSNFVTFVVGDMTGLFMNPQWTHVKT